GTASAAELSAEELRQGGCPGAEDGAVPASIRGFRRHAGLPRRVRAAKSRRWIAAGDAGRIEDLAAAESQRPPGALPAAGSRSALRRPSSSGRGGGLA